MRTQATVPRPTRLVPLVNSVLIILVTYNLAQITWRLLSPPAGTIRQQPIPQLSVITLPSTAAPDVRAIADWHLFDELDNRAPVMKIVKAPETKLNLRLAGTFFTQSPELPPLALIAEGSGPERNYKVGDFLTDSVRIHEILTDRVILSRNGRLEALLLPKNSASRAPASGRTVSTAPTAAAAAVADNDSPSRPREVRAGAIAAQMRQDMQTDMSRLQELAFVSPYVQNGRFVGFQLQPGNNHRLLLQLGLRNGDVITEVNGTLLTDPSQGTQILQQMLTAERLDAKVLRNGSEIPFTFLLNQ